MHVFRHEVNARRYVQKTFWIGLATLVALAVFWWRMDVGMPNELKSKWDFVLPSVVFVLLFAVVLFGLGPLMWKVPPGTFFRVTLTEKRLQVESPHEHFGQSCDIELDEIGELRTVMSGTDDLRHEIHTKSGSRLELNHNGGLRPELVFERVLELRPEIPHRKGQEKEFTGKS